MEREGGRERRGDGQRERRRRDGWREGEVCVEVGEVY